MLRSICTWVYGTVCAIVAPSIRLVVPPKFRTRCLGRPGGKQNQRRKLLLRNSPEDSLRLARESPPWMEGRYRGLPFLLPGTMCPQRYRLGGQIALSSSVLDLPLEALNLSRSRAHVLALSGS